MCHTTLAIAVTWAAALAISTPSIIFFDTSTIDFANGEERIICSFNSDENDKRLYQSLFFATSLAVPLAAILWLYMNMLVRLWRGAAALAQGRGPARDASNNVYVGGGGARGQENKRRVTRMVVIVIIAFAICWTPLQVRLQTSLSAVDACDSKQMNALSQGYFAPFLISNVLLVDTKFHVVRFKFAIPVRYLSSYFKISFFPSLFFRFVKLL